jgi:hypothetical protein
VKILFLNIYYPEFLERHYANNKIMGLSYMEQWESVQGTMHGDADFYSRGMSKQGWETHDLITNCDLLQNQWATENDYRGRYPIWVEQIRQLKPDVVYSQGLWLINDDTYPLIKDHCKLIAGQVASPASFDVKNFDCIFSSMPHFVERFREHGTTSYYMPLAFDSRANTDENKVYDVTFVGGFTPNHLGRIEFLEEISKSVEVDCWTGNLDSVKESPRLHHHPAVWGRDMFEVLGRSYITLNYHIDCAEDYANNMRLYEATGCGSLLITDWKKNLGDLFSPDEIVSFDSVDDAVEVISYYLKNKEEGKLIAERGQKRTLTDHTYEKRMADTAVILEGML